MVIFKIAEQLSLYLSNQKNKGKKIGFVPTMGALHDGHLSLVKCCKAENDITICSIFVNPTQFNNKDDLNNYPSTIEKDIALLVKADNDVLFLPSESEVYPPGYNPGHYDLGTLEHIWEGQYRPGHFQGVSQVVDRLLELVDPDNLYMGQKDFQQCLVIRRLLSLTGRDENIKLHIIPTERQANGLAMSSRNLRLNDQQLQIAPLLFRELNEIRKEIKNFPIKMLIEQAKKNLTNVGFAVDYLTVVRKNDLAELDELQGECVILVAASLGKIRLIDNLLI